MRLDMNDCGVCCCFCFLVSERALPDVIAKDVCMGSRVCIPNLSAFGG